MVRQDRRSHHAPDVQALTLTASPTISSWLALSRIMTMASRTALRYSLPSLCRSQELYQRLLRMRKRRPKTLDGWFVKLEMALVCVIAFAVL